MTRPSATDSASEASSPAGSTAVSMQAGGAGKPAIALALKLSAVVALALLWVLLSAQPLG